MEILIICVFGILILIIIILLIRMHLMKKAAMEIKQAFEERLKEDTNTLIDISSHDPHMRQLASSINQQLKVLRLQRHHYQQGDQRLKQAVTNISHDLRTPLTAIFGYLDLLESEEKSETVNRYLNIIRNRCNALKQLMEELYTYTSGTSKVISRAKYEKVTLNHVLEACISTYYADLKKRKIEPVISITDKPIIATLDQRSLVRIIDNILSNAIKYSDGDLTIHLDDTGKMIFSNHAAVLDEVLVNQLFDRFYTVESGVNSSGLGLTIAKELTNQMNGTIDADYKHGILSIHLQFSENKTAA